jgi:hypothetical protein
MTIGAATRTTLLYDRREDRPHRFAVRIVHLRIRRVVDDFLQLRVRALATASTGAR